MMEGEDIKPVITNNGLVYPRAPPSISLLPPIGGASSASVAGSTPVLALATSLANSPGSAPEPARPEQHGPAPSSERQEDAHKGAPSPHAPFSVSGNSTLDTARINGGNNTTPQPRQERGSVDRTGVRAEAGSASTQDWLPPSTPTNFGTVSSTDTTSGGPATKRQRIRYAKPENVCSICGHRFKYIRHHYAKWHPNLVIPDGGVGDDARSVRDGTTPGVETGSGFDWRNSGEQRTTGINGSGSVSGTPMASRMTFGGVSAGRFCARCGLVVEDLDLHRQLEHGIPPSDTESIQNPIVQYENGILPPMSTPSRSRHAGEAMLDWNAPASNAALRVHEAVPTNTTSRQMTPISQQPQTPKSNSESKPVPTTLRGRLSSSSLGEEPYEKLLRIIRATSELTSTQKSSLIFDVLKQQTQLLPHSFGTSSMAMVQQIQRPSTAVDTTPETPCHVEQGVESDGTQRHQIRRPRDGDAQYVSPKHRGRNATQRAANDDDDLYS